MSDLIQSDFDYSMLPIGVSIAARTAAERIKLRLKRTVEDIIEIGRELTEVKEQLPHGQFLPWIAAEFEMSDQMAQEFMRVFRRFGNEKQEFLVFKPSVLYALAAPSTPDSVIEKAIEHAESGDKVTVADVKDWKADYESERQARELAEQRAREFVAESNERRKKIGELETQIDLLKSAEKPKPVVKEVVPDDYEAIKRKVVELQAQNESSNKELDHLKKQQDKIVNDNVQFKLRERHNELQELDRRRETLEDLVKRNQERLDALSSEERRITVHRETIDCIRLDLISLAAFLSDLTPIEDADTIKRWLALGGMLDEAAIAIRQCFGSNADRLNLIAA